MMKNLYYLLSTTTSSLNDNNVDQQNGRNDSKKNFKSLSYWFLLSLKNKCLRTLAIINRLFFIIILHTLSIGFCNAFSILSSSSFMSNNWPSSTHKDNQISTTQQLFRHKRDEEPAPIYGKGIAFWLGEHCETTCNRILFHVWCNSTTHRCECLPEYPVNVENKYCLKALQINDHCEYTESCRFLNPNSECNEQGLCKCMPGYFVKYDDEKEIITCIAYDSPLFIRIGSTTFDFINKIEFVTLFSLIISFILILILSMMVIKLIHKNKKLAKNEQPSFCDIIPPPPPVILNAQPDHYNHHHVAHHQYHHQSPPSLQSSPSRSPYHQDYSLQEKSIMTSSYNIPPLPSNINDFRRQSLSSLRSQSSTKSLSSFRSQHSYRNNHHHHHQHHQSYHRTTAIHCQQQSKIATSNISNRSHHDLGSFQMRQHMITSGSPLDNQTSQSGYLLPNHLPTNSQSSRIKCANHRCGTGSKVRSEVCLVHNMPEIFQQQQQQEEIFVPTMK